MGRPIGHTSGGAADFAVFPATGSFVVTLRPGLLEVTDLTPGDGPGSFTVRGPEV